MREHSFIHPDNAKLYKLAWLAPMAQEVSTMLEVDTLEVVADAGYFNQEQIKQCLDIELCQHGSNVRDLPVAKALPARENALPGYL